METEKIPMNSPVASVIARGLQIGKYLSELSADGKTTWRDCIREWKLEADMSNKTIRACFGPSFTDEHIATAMFNQ